MSEQDIRNNEYTDDQDVRLNPFGRPERQRPYTSYERDRAAKAVESAASEQETPARITASRSSRTRSFSASEGRSSSSRTFDARTRTADARTRTSDARTTEKSGSSAKRKKKKSSFLPMFYFPVLFVWLELVLHIFMKMQIKYAPIYLAHGLMYGCVFNFLTFIWPKKASLVVGKVLSFFASLVFCIEFVAKNILQDFYGASMIRTAMGNHLTDYIGAILAFIGARFYVLLLFLAPTILIIIFIRQFPRMKIKKRGVAILSVIAAVILYLVGRFFIILPWNGSISPKELYKSDTNYDDQVEQLGLSNFIRLDIQHMIKPVESGLDPSAPVTPDNPVGPGSETPPEDPAVDTSPNMINLNLDAVASSSSNKSIQNLANYFKGVTPTKKNQYTGIFKDYNVVFLTVEGLSGYVISPEYTPTLYKIAHEGFVFNNFYTALHFTSTSNGECQNLLGLYPKNGFPITMSRTGELKTNTYFSLAQQLNRAGYNSYGYHNNINMYNREASHKNLGYNWKYIHYSANYSKYNDCIDYEGSGGENSGKLRWPQRDSFMAEHTSEDYIHSDKPFNVYYMTITGHTPYTYGSWAFNEWRETVDKTNYSESTKAYIAAAMECDKAVKILMDKIEAEGKLDKTVFVVVPDHIPYFDIDILEELSGKKFGNTEDFQAINETNINFDVYHSYLAIWSPSIADKNIQVNKVCCQVDILPTLSNLLGLEYDSRMLAGSDILSTSEGMVIFSSRSWRTNVGTYNSRTKVFTPAEGVTLTKDAQDSYIKYMNNVANSKTGITAMIVESNFYNYALATDKFRISGSSQTTSGGKEELEKTYSEDYMLKLITEFKNKNEMVKPNKGLLGK